MATASPAPETPGSITVALDEATARRVHEIAVAQGISDEAFMSGAISEAAAREADFRAFVQAGIDSADRGELVPQGEVFKNLRQRRRNRAA